MGIRPITFEDIDNLKPSEDSKNKHLEGIKKVHDLYLSGENRDASFISRSRDERIATDPWAEFEKEEEFIARDPRQQQINKTGGRIHFSATLKQVSAGRKHPTDYKVELNPVELGTSCSFSRRFGSKSFFRLKLNKTLVQSDTNLIRFLSKPIVLCNSVYRAFYGKEQTAFYFKTKERWDASRSLIVEDTSSPGLGLRDFLDWYNPIHENQRQTMAKWAARFALGLSSSIHGITLEPNDIEEINDIKSETGSDMTDGAGFITRRLLEKLAREHDWPTRPSVIQVRVRGAKGLLVEHPTIDSETGIQLRPSLIKIHYPGPLDPTQRTVDILRTSHARSPTRISVDVIINLSENGVGADALQVLLKRTVDEIIQPLLQWNLEDRTVLQELWLNFERSGSVLKSRRAREEVALARVSGHTERDTTEEVQEDDEEAQVLEDAGEGSVEWWPDDISGCPSSLEETIMAFLDSGFHPSNCAMLREKISRVVAATISRVIENCYIDIPFSATAWIIPDPLGVLEPNQLFFKSSHSNLVALDGTESDIITGDVLITRDPCRLPSDVQKWRAVDRLQLHYLKDVIVLSVKGPRRAADWLAGGDYDGDKAKLIWQPELVRGFKNADPEYADPPSDLDAYFKIRNERVVDFLERIKPLSLEDQLYETQKHLLGTMTGQGVVGLYSGFHEYSTCVNGYKHPTTKLLAYIFTTVLDGRKTGKSIREEVFKQHQKEFGAKKLLWKESLRKKSDGDKLADTSNVKPTNRGKGKPPFIMETLVEFGKKLGRDKLAELKRWKEGFIPERDSQLLEPMEEVERKIKALKDKKKDAAATALEEDYELIKAHVARMYRQHQEVLQQAQQSNGAGFTNLPIQKRQDILRKLSQKFHSEPAQSELNVMSKVMSGRIKASYAYSYDWDRGKPSRFPWNVAFRDLCCIKTGDELKPVHKSFYDYMVIKLPKRRHRA